MKCVAVAECPENIQDPASSPAGFLDRDTTCLIYGWGMFRGVLICLRGDGFREVREEARMILNLG